MNNTILRQRYRLNQLIGRGSMGQVWQALDTQSSKPVAIKQMCPELRNNETLFARFKREVTLLNRLDHPNIMPALDYFIEDDGIYLVMPLMAGSLLDLLELQGALPVEWVRQIGRDVCDALAQAHRLGIIHRDIKPDNIVIAPNGIPLVSDFSTARLSDSTLITHEGTTLGSIHYLSPEVCQGEKAGISADIWALGVVFYEMLTGRVPFDHHSPYKVAHAILNEPIPQLQERRPDVPPEMLDLMDKILEKDLAFRIDSMAAVAEALAQVPDVSMSPQPWPPVQVSHVS